ncbi:ArfGap-domain-containing protein [Xylariaceae sp. FL1272]|nr:ArfGap-domain-containing protein [Xylariaceae sp. FL1272]
MSGLMSKRQQARNERALQDLVHTIPGNSTCADCGARNPAWASWSLGVFLCMRCAAIHRKLGTHISKVKSLSMDSWTNDQVDSMRKVGNATSNKKYNPQSKRPPVPVDADEADSAMERFIRSKYTQPEPRSPMTGSRRHNTGSSDEGTPPPLPPKTGGRFFKSATLPFRSKKETRSPRDSSFPNSDMSSGANRSSNIFGATIQNDGVEDTARKLTQLRDMGFADDKRNAMVLKGVNGNLERTVESLIRLGEGNGAISPAVTISRDPFSASVTPKPTKSPMNGLSLASKPSPPLPVQSPSTSSNNDPWEIQPAPPQSSQSTGTIQNKNPFYNASTTNPFGVPNQQNDFGLNQSLQNLSLTQSHPQQPLFPNHTGGAPMSQPMSQPQYQQSATPPVPQMPNFASVAFNNNQTYPQSVQQSPQQGYNPFLQAPATSQQSLSVNTGMNQPQGTYGSNPFTKSPTRIGSPMLNQIPEQFQQNVYNSPQSQFSSNPFMSQQAQSPLAAQPHQQQWYQNQQPGQMSQPAQQQQQQQQWYETQQPAQTPQQSYQPQRQDSASIMALYNYPHLAPARTGMQSAEQGNVNAFNANQAPAQAQVQTPIQQSPSTATNNPFLNNTTTQQSSPFGTANTGTSSARSRESMMLGMEMAWNNGRHSPDAFASLSARSG